MSTSPAAPATVFAGARERFSALRCDFVFLDAPGGTQVPDEVGDAVARVYRESSGNTGAPYATSRRLDTLVEEARVETALFLGCDSDEVIFGGSTTSLNFTLSRTLGRQLQPGDEIVVTRLDHDGNVAPWLDLARDLQLQVRHADVHADTTLDLADLQRQLSPRTRVVAFPWAANSVGTIVDARAVCDLAHQAGALAWIDAVQYAPHQPMDAHAIGADIVLCSAYKFCGPHLGIAFGRRELLESWQPYKARPVPSEPVGHSFETGTVAYELLGGLLAALGYHDSLGGMAAIASWERELGERLLAGLPATANLYGLPTMDGRVPTFLVNFDGIDSDQLSVELAERGFGVWSHGSYYALGLHERIGWGTALRIGLAHYNTLSEVDRFCEVLGSLVQRPSRPGAGQDPGAGQQPGARLSATVVQPLGAGPGTLASDAHVRHLVSTGPQGLVRCLAEVPPAAQLDGVAGPGGDLWFVLGGTGRLTLAGADLPLGPDQGVLLPPGAQYRVSATGGAALRLDVVALPPAVAGEPASAADPAGPVTRQLADSAAEVTGDRRFRVLFGPGQGCAVATQFVGEIPPGRAPDHSHPYDEVVLILSGSGIAHADGSEHALSAGTCIHLPPGVTHCLENTGPGTMRVLGVFHPADSPAAKLPGAGTHNQ